MEKFKALSYSTKANIFVWASAAVAIVNIVVPGRSLLGEVLWTTVWGVGVFFWGAAYAQYKTPKSYVVRLYPDKSVVQ